MSSAAVYKFVASIRFSSLHNPSCEHGKVDIFLGQCDINPYSKPPSSPGTILPISQLCTENDPRSLSGTNKFIKALEKQIDICLNSNEQNLYLGCAAEPGAHLDACFLLGAYLILSQNTDTENLIQTFSPFFSLNPLDSQGIGKHEHEVILDSWGGLQRAKAGGLLSLLANSTPATKRSCDDFNIQIVASKLVLLQGIESAGPNALARLQARSILTVVRLLAQNPDPTAPEPESLCPGVRPIYLSFDGSVNPPPRAVSFLFRKVVVAPTEPSRWCAGRTGPRAARRRWRRCT